MEIGDWSGKIGDWSLGARRFFDSRRGGRIDQTGTDGDTPLIRALKLPDDGDTKAEKYGAAKSALVELLLARGAGPNVCDDEGHSPLYHAGYQKPMGDVIRKAGGYRSNIET